MRPEVLFDLFAPITGLRGIGPRLAKALEKPIGARVVDLLWHLPTGVIDRRHTPKVAAAVPGEIATMIVRVQHHDPSQGPRRPYRVVCADETATLVLVFFHAREEHLLRLLPPGELRVVSGTVDRYGDTLQMPHPDYVGKVEELETIQTVEPVYPLTGGIGLRVLSKAVIAALDRAPDLPEWQDPAFVARQGWLPWKPSLSAAHRPASAADTEPTTPARSRLAYDELLANQLALSLVRRSLRRLPGRAVRGDGRLARPVTAALPFRLTPSQQTALAEIATDMASDGRMLRLLQGDVGSGKTIVALLAMLAAVETGHQAALMAPTDVLARQHMTTIEPLAAAAGISIALLTGREKGKARERIVAGLADGSISLTVGTHALVQQDVDFHDLALAVIDEQHRFGVHQRLHLSSKGKGVDILVMTATPIPRTLMLTAYGDMEVSRLTEKPAGRKPVDTRTVPAGRLDEVVAAVGRALTGGAKAFWVCPLVSESEALDVAAAEQRFAALQETFGPRVGLIHGRMKGADKDRMMADFIAGPVDILVATTVIEVGVDVPAATVMVIEHAERFGLAQLHQLRGRIGRGDRPSTCLLVYAAPLGETARTRLAVIRETDDGFRIAEEDLKLRGAGELLGTRQSGLPEFRLADLAVHGDLLQVARADAKLVIERDPELRSPRGQALRTLLYLFERDAAVAYLRSG